MSQSRSRVTRVFATAAVLTAVACAPERSPTVPVLPEDASLAAGGNGNGGGGAKVKIKTLQLASTTLTVDGPSTVATISIGNSGLAIESGVSIIAEVAQPAAFHEAANVQTSCAPGAGSLPKGTCTMTFDVRASSSTAGAGDFESGPAVLRVRVLQTANGNTTELATRTIDVNVVVVPSTPFISSLTPAFDQLMISGRTESASIEIDNPGPQRSTVLVKGWIVQRGVREVAINENVECGGTSGLLPSGTCTTLTSVSVRPTISPPFGLIPGAATLEIQLTLRNDTTETPLDTKSVAVTLVEATPWIAGSTVQPTIAIGTNVQIAIVVTNPTLNTYPNSGVVVNVLQSGVTTQVASGAPSCGTLGVIPRGDCIVTVTVNLGTGSFSPGAAKVELRLTTDSGATLLDVEQYDVTLVTP